jgi:hypothetical protein
MVVPEVQAVRVPPKQTAPRGTRKPAAEAVARAHRGLSRNMLVLGTIALLTLGGVSLFLASKDGGNIFNIFQNTTNQIINNSYFTQLIASGATTEEDLQSIAEIRPYGDGFIGVSKAAMSWEEAVKLAQRCGARMLEQPVAAGEKKRLVDWMLEKLEKALQASAWTQIGSGAGLFSGGEFLRLGEPKGNHVALLQWLPKSTFVGNGGSTTTKPSLASKERPFINSLGMKFVPVPGTQVLFCVHETRQSDYLAFSEEAGPMNQAWRSPIQEGVPLGNGEDFPVLLVSWDDAKHFCAWLSKQDGLHYRLPSDSEWSKAIVSDGISAKENGLENYDTKFPWGYDFPPPPNSGNFRDIATSKKFPDLKFIEGYNDGFATLAPVMSFPPNKLGLYDLSGNVAEWCEDIFDSKRPDKRVYRGGNWGDANPFYLESMVRLAYGKEARSFIHGFRVVIDFSDATGEPTGEARKDK